MSFLISSKLLQIRIVAAANPHIQQQQHVERKPNFQRAAEVLPSRSSSLQSDTA